MINKILGQELLVSYKSVNMQQSNKLDSINLIISNLSMIINQDQNTSSSLEIVQPENRISFTSHDSSALGPGGDKDLSYSKDQSSFSIRIEDETIRSSYGHSYINNQPPKRIRREIFDKYKTHLQNHHENQNTPTYSSGENDIMRAFDEIFSLSTPKSVAVNERQSTEQRKIFQRKSYNQTLDTKKTPQQKKQSINQYNSLKTPQKKPIQNINPKASYARDQTSQLLNSGSFFKTPLDYSIQKKPQIKAPIPKYQALNLSDIENRVSFIHGSGNVDFSRDSYDLGQFLNAQIFKDDQIQQSTKIVRTVQDKIKVQTIKQPINTHINQTKQPFAKKLPGTYQQRPFITPSPVRQPIQKQLTQQEIQRNFLHQQYLQRQRQQALNMQQSSVSDVYQKIDMSQSIANSVVIKDHRAKIFDNNYNYNSYSNLGSLGLERVNSVRNFSRSGSSGFLNLPIQNNSLINNLRSQRIIEQASEQQRISIFFRKAVKLNSIIPNFANPSIQHNFEEQNKKLQQLVNSFNDAIKFLQLIFQNIHAKQLKKRQIAELFSTGITVNKFKSCNWESCMDIQGLAKLMPKQNFYAARQWKPARVQQALKNYREIAQSHKGIRINLKDERGVAKYFQIRRKYWDIQKNVLMIIQDMYTHILCLGFPKHYEQFKKVLEQTDIVFNQSQIRYKKIQLEELKKLRSKNQELSVSEVGTTVLMKLAHQIKFNSNNF